MTTATPQTDRITLEEINHERGRRVFARFLSFVRIQNTTLDTTGDEVPTGETAFEQWPHLMYFVLCLTLHRSIIVLKARQIGLSWILAAYALWVALYKPGSTVIIISKDQEAAQRFLRRCKFIYERLPKPMQVQIKGQWAKGSVEFGHDSSMTAMPATEDAGRSETATLVIQDEADFHQHFEDNFTAVRPTVADSGGQHVIVSTPQWEKADSYFKVKFAEANDIDDKGAVVTEKPSPLVRLYFPWHVRPGRDEAFIEEQRASLGEERTHKEYSSSIEEALAPPQSACAFNIQMLNSMREDCFDPLPHVIKEAPHARIFYPFKPGNRYAAFSDTSHGTGHDYSVTVVVDCTNDQFKRVVADIKSNTIVPYVFAYESVQLLDAYGTPLWGIESNDRGALVIEKAKELKYKRLYWTRSNRGRSEYVGYNTNSSSRNLLFGALQSEIANGEWLIPARDGLQHFYDTVVKPEKDGRIEAVEGRNDDYVIAVGGTIQMWKNAVVPFSGREHRTRNDPRVAVLAGRQERRGASTGFGNGW